MFKSNLKGKILRTAAGIGIASMAITASGAISGPSAGADPKQFSALVGVGSDTIQDIANALAGSANGISYNPIQSSSASFLTQITSWDAAPGTPCITPKAPGATINRPNGSGAGLKALSRAIDGGNWGDTTCGAAAKPTSGLIDFARSSKGPANGDLGTDLTYIPVGRDGVSFGYYANSGVVPADVITSLTRAQLTSLFTTGPQLIGPAGHQVNIVPCGIQTSSGTYGFWNTVTTASVSAENTATTTCNNANAQGRVEENNATMLKAKGDALAAQTPTVPAEVIVGFSAAQFISQSNGRAVSHLATGVDLGAISDNGSGTNLGKPYSGTAPTLAPVGGFYGDTVFGRNVYVVVDTGRATGVGNNDLKSLFVGPTSAICNTGGTTPPTAGTAQATVNLFGFLTPSNCGATTITGTLIAGSI